MPSGDHSYHPVEQDANARAFKYFNENVSGFYKTEDEYNSGNRGWDFRSNPLNISNRGIGNYVDFKNSDQMKQVNALKQHSGFFDYYSPFTADIGGMGIVSLFHHVQYNGTKQHGWVPINNEKK